MRGLGTRLGLWIISIKKKEDIPGTIQFLPQAHHGRVWEAASFSGLDVRLHKVVCVEELHQTVLSAVGELEESPFHVGLHGMMTEM